MATAPWAASAWDLIRDENGDEIWDAGEPIIATVTTTSTLGANNGNYLFTGVPAGDYLVHVSDTNGVLLDYLKSPLGDQALNNHNKADPYPVQLLNPGDSELRADFGYYKNPDVVNNGVIGNQVWIEIANDGDGDDGVFDVYAEDVGQAGVTMELLQGGTVVMTTTTGASGDYAFLHLPGGSYEVRVSDDAGVLASLDVSLSYPNNNIDNTNKPQPFSVNLPQGGFNLTADFAYTTDAPPLLSTSTIGNLVWNDANADGRYQVGESGFGNVTVQLWYDTNNTCALDAGDVLVATQTTNNLIALGGNYRFVDEYISGNYLVLVTDLNGVLTNYSQTVGASQTLDGYSKYPQPYCIQNFNPTNTQDVNLRADFGYVLSQSGYQIAKKLNTAEPVRVGSPISFTITITNVGAVPITKLPLRDSYNNTFLTFGYPFSPYATPAPDNTVDDGQIDWSDLTASFGDLAPTFSFQVVVTFTARADTTSIPPDGKAPNTAIVQGAETDPDGPGPQPPLTLPTQQDIAKVSIFNPTGLRLGSLTATPQDSDVLVRWSTASEVDILGFNVLRAEVVDGVASDFTTRNGMMMIASYAGADRGENYVFRDDEVEAGVNYRYKLEVVKLNGTTEMYGNAEITLAARRLFAPMILR